MLKINEHYRVMADSYSYALQEKRVTQKGEDSWNPVGYYPTIIGALKKVREINRKSLLSADEVLLIGDLITQLEAIDEAFLKEIQAIEDKIKEEVALKQAQEAETEETTEAKVEVVATEPTAKTKRKPRKQKIKELPSCFVEDEKDSSKCIGEPNPTMFAESDCIHCDSYGCPEIV